MRVCKNSRTGEYINDFQDNPSPGTLINNAVRAGIASSGDLVEVEVSPTMFSEIKATVLEPIHKKSASDQVATDAKVKGVKTKLKGLGLTDEDISLLKRI